MGSHLESEELDMRKLYSLTRNLLKYQEAKLCCFSVIRKIVENCFQVPLWGPDPEGNRKTKQGNLKALGQGSAMPNFVEIHVILEKRPKVSLSISPMQTLTSW